MDADAITNRIKKLLALAANNSNVHEAAEAAAEAQRLMLRHQIEAVHLGDGPAPVERRAVQEGSGSRRAVMWHVALAGVLARRMHVDVVYISGSTQIDAIGRATDVAALAVLYHHLRAYLERAADVAWASLPHSQRTHGGKVRWVDTFHRGARAAIDQRMEAQRGGVAQEQADAAARQGAPAESQALVRAGALATMDAYGREAAAAIQRWKDERGLRFVHQTRTVKSAGRDAYQAGQAAGQRADLRPNARTLPGRR